MRLLFASVLFTVHAGEVASAKNLCTPSEKEQAFRLEQSVWNGFAAFRDGMSSEQQCRATRNFISKLKRMEDWSAEHPECVVSQAQFRKFRSTLRQLERGVKASCK